MLHVVAIALGGALGALARYFMARWVMEIYGGVFPLGIMAVNIVGAFFLGVCVMLFAARLGISEAMQAFLTVGFLGAFTTFSTFTLDIYGLVNRADWWGSAGYVILSIGASLLALLMGLRLGRVIFLT